MKKTFIPLLPALLVVLILATGCLKNNNNQVDIPSPTGNFGGSFKLLRKRVGQTTVDTLKKANIVLALDGTGNFKVTGDTATVHAGSLGTYQFNQTYMAFTDKTAPATGTSAKVRLFGTYLYSYDGSANLILLINQGDTLNYRYDLKRTN